MSEWFCMNCGRETGGLYSTCKRCGYDPRTGPPPEKAPEEPPEKTPEERRCMNYREGDDLLYGPLPPTEKSPESRQCMNYREGDDLLYGPLPPTEKIPSAIDLIVRPEDWVRDEEAAFGGKPNCNVPVLQASEITIDQAVALLGTEGTPRMRHFRAIEVDISYPLKHTVTALFGPYTINGRAIMAPGYVLWQIARAYRRIYAEEALDGRHGIWGHCLNDLVIEALIPHKSGWCEIFVGS